MLEQKAWLAGLGGIYLCYVGVQMLLRARVTAEASAADLNVESQKSGVVSAYASTFLLTLTNPMTILAFLAIYAGLGLVAGTGDYASATLLVIGVFLGSAAWWLLLSGVADRLRDYVNANVLCWVNVVAGCVIIGFGLFALIGIAL